MNSKAIDPKTLIDQSPVGAFHVGLLALCGVMLMLDGFDTQVIGYAAPALVTEWNVSRSALGPIFSAGLFGLMLGAMVFGPLADRYGRRPALLVCVATFAILTLISSTAANLPEMMACRLLGGLGLGGAMPNAIALVAEFSPTRVRGRMITILVCGFSAGAALGGFLAAWIIPNWGWRPLMAVGGGAPLLMLPLMWSYLPESLRFLGLREGTHAAIARVLARLAPQKAISSDATFGVADRPAAASPVQLFTQGRSATTALLWIGFFMNLVVLYFLASYLPTLLNAKGLPLDKALRATAMYQVGGIVGAITIGFLIDRFRPANVIGLVLALGTLFIAAIPLAEADFTLICLGTFGAGFCIVGGQIGANAFTGTIYPTAVRSTGVGWALGVGRFGSVTAPLMVGALLAAHWQIANIFYAAVLPTLLAALALFAAGAAERRKRPNAGLLDA